MRQIWKSLNKTQQLHQERNRYNAIARSLNEKRFKGEILEAGVEGIPIWHQFPYLAYYEVVEKLINSESNVLELGAGTGRHTGVLLKTGAAVSCLDISEESLHLLSLRFGGKLEVICSSMDCVPVPNASFEFIVCVGSLSYADFESTWSEIRRILKPGGGLILLDTLNHNPIYWLNRFLHFLRGRRTFLTLVRMPKMSNIERISGEFSDSNFYTFGQFYWLLMLLKPLLGFKMANKLVTSIESKRPRSRFAFKFLLVAHGFKQQP